MEQIEEKKSKKIKLEILFGSSFFGQPKQDVLIFQIFKAVSLGGKRKKMVFLRIGGNFLFGFLDNCFLELKFSLEETFDFRMLKMFSIVNSFKKNFLKKGKILFFFFFSWNLKSKNTKETNPLLVGLRKPQKN